MGEPAPPGHNDRPRKYPGDFLLVVQITRCLCQTCGEVKVHAYNLLTDKELAETCAGCGRKTPIRPGNGHK